MGLTALKALIRQLLDSGTNVAVRRRNHLIKIQDLFFDNSYGIPEPDSADENEFGVEIEWVVTAGPTGEPPGVLQLYMEFRPDGSVHHKIFFYSRGKDWDAGPFTQSLSNVMNMLKALFVKHPHATSLKTKTTQEAPVPPKPSPLECFIQDLAKENSEDSSTKHRLLRNLQIEFIVQAVPQPDHVFENIFGIDLEWNTVEGLPIMMRANLRKNGTFEYIVRKRDHELHYLPYLTPFLDDAIKELNSLFSKYPIAPALPIQIAQETTMPPEPTNPLPINEQIDQIGAAVISEVTAQREAMKFIINSLRSRSIPDPTYVRGMGNGAVEFGWLPDQDKPESPGNHHRKTHLTCQGPGTHFVDFYINAMGVDKFNLQQHGDSLGVVYDMLVFLNKIGILGGSHA